MSDVEPGKDKAQVPQKPKAKSSPSRGLFPPIWVWVVVGVSAAAIAYVRIATVTGDHAVVNLLTLIIGFLAFVAIALWFLLFSGYPFLFRVTVLTVGFLSVMAASFVLRLEQVTGEMIPSFKWRWTPAPDELLRIPESEAPSGRIDVVTTTENDYPQFLGPRRNLRVDHLTIQPDWTAQPPRLLWRQPIGAGWSGFSVVNGFAFTLEQRGTGELVTCYVARSGELLWSQGIKSRHYTVMGGTGPRSTPTIDEGRVYTLGPTGQFFCLDGASGDVLWEMNVVTDYGGDADSDIKGVAWGRSASPLVVDDLVVVPVGGPVNGPKVSLAAFAKETGELAWEAGNSQVSYASPVLGTLGGVRQILSVNEDNVTGHVPETGDVLWTYEWPGSSNAEASVSQPVVLTENRVLLSKGYFVGSALLNVAGSSDEPFSANTEWESRRSLKTKFTNVVVHGDYVYGLSDGILECVEWGTGKAAWKRGRYGHGQVLGVNDLLLVQAESGEVALVEASPAKFNELAVFPAIEGKTWNNLCLFGSLLLVRNAEEAACYELAVEPIESETPAE